MIRTFLYKKSLRWTPALDGSDASDFMHVCGMLPAGRAENDYEGSLATKALMIDVDHGGGTAVESTCRCAWPGTVRRTRLMQLVITAAQAEQIAATPAGGAMTGYAAVVKVTRLIGFNSLTVAGLKLTAGPAPLPGAGPPPSAEAKRRQAKAREGGGVRRTMSVFLRPPPWKGRGADLRQFVFLLCRDWNPPLYPILITFHQGLPVMAAHQAR